MRTLAPRRHAHAREGGSGKVHDIVALAVLRVRQDPGGFDPARLFLDLERRQRRDLAAREALGQGPSDEMFATAGSLGAPPEALAPGEGMVTFPGVFRLVIADFDWSNSTVAESIMVIIERAADAELARPIPGSL